jgi:hypothetical protein
MKLEDVNPKVRGQVESLLAAQAKQPRPIFDRAALAMAVLGQNPTMVTGTPKARLRQDRSEPNKWEAAFDTWIRDYLQTRDGWKVWSQSIRLRLGNGAWYKPDVIAVGVGETRFYEVKGFARQRGILAIKVAASLYPCFHFWLATKRPKKRGGGWDTERVLP